MFYAASEIVFWILLAAIVGGGIGYGLAQAKTLRLNKRLTQSRADAPMERELAVAWDTIEDLNRRLQVAHQTIRDSHPQDESATEDAADPDVVQFVDTTEPIEPNEPETAEPVEDNVVEMSIDFDTGEPAAENGQAPAKAAPASKPAAKKATKAKTPAKKASTAKSATSSPAAKKATAPKAAAKKPAPPAPAEPSDETVGKRLSERVASASNAANKLDFTDGGA